MILTERAKSIIRRDIAAGWYKEQEHAREPPFMAPSTDPARYSTVRSPSHLFIKPHSFREVVFVLQ